MSGRSDILTSFVEHFGPLSEHVGVNRAASRRRALRIAAIDP